MLALYPLILRSLRRIPAHEYAQLERTPAWFTVAVGGGIALLSLIGLRQVAPDGAQVFLGLPRTNALLLVDAYTLWGSMILGMVMAVAAWVPAARRSLAPRNLPYFLVTLVLAWFALLLLFSVQWSVLLTSWLLLLIGLLLLWTVLFRPGWRWEQLEIFVVLALAGIAGSIGLVWLRGIAQGNDLATMWSVLFSAAPRAVNGALLFIALGWVGPAVYLPWWLWQRRTEEGMVWMPAGLVTAVAGVLALVRLLFFTFPPGGGALAQVPGVEQFFLIQRLLGWMLAWGMLSLLAGTVWIAILAAMRRPLTAGSFRPLMLVASGLLLMGLAGGLLGMAGTDMQRNTAINGLLWAVFMWAGGVTVWLCAGHLLPALALHERSERTALHVACWLALAGTVAIPPTAGFRGVAALWPAWQHAGLSPILVLASLAVTAIAIGVQLPRWVKLLAAPEARPGAGWGVLGPFALAVMLLVWGLFAGPFAPLFMLIRHSLLQAY